MVYIIQIIFPILGEIRAETEDGKFIARGSESRIQGHSLKAITKSGDINIESNCYAEECHLISQQGNVRFRTVYGSAVNIKITEIGNASVCIIKGSLNMNIANGNAKLFISSLTEDSVTNISDGNVYLNVPKHMKGLFKLKVTTPSVKIDSNLKPLFTFGGRFLSWAN